jgi:hypothetical protein
MNMRSRNINLLPRGSPTGALWDLGRSTNTQTVFLHQAIAQSVGLNATDTKCIDLILSHPEGYITAGSLSGMTGLTTGAITHILDRLEKRQFIGACAIRGTAAKSSSAYGPTVLNL